MKDALTMIRQYTDNDVDAVVTIWRDASALAHPFLTPAFLEAEAENVRNVYPKYADIWVKEFDGQVVGFIALLGAEVGAIFLDPHHHGKGMGRELMDFAAKMRGALTVDVFRDNTIGRAFYDAYGFKPTGEYLHEASGQMTIKMAYEPKDA